MLKRVTWFAAGTVVGAAGAAWTYTRIRELRGGAVADEVTDRVTARLRDAVAEGLSAMRETTATLAQDVESTR